MFSASAVMLEADARAAGGHSAHVWGALVDEVPALALDASQAQSSRGGAAQHPMNLSYDTHLLPHDVLRHFRRFHTRSLSAGRVALAAVREAEALSRSLAAEGRPVDYCQAQLEANCSEVARAAAAGAGPSRPSSLRVPLGPKRSANSLKTSKHTKEAPEISLTVRESGAQSNLLDYWRPEARANLNASLGARKQMSSVAPKASLSPSPLPTPTPTRTAIREHRAHSVSDLEAFRREIERDRDHELLLQQMQMAGRQTGNMATLYASAARAMPLYEVCNAQTRLSQLLVHCRL